MACTVLKGRAMAKSIRGGALITALVGAELLTIAAGIVATSIVIIKFYAGQGARRRDDAVPAVKALSACEGGSGTKSTLHAWLNGAELSGDPLAPPPVVDDALRARGAELFAQNCATCHGTRGDGKGPTAVQLAHPPADFTVGTYELRTTEHEALPADIDLFRTMTRGVHGTAMPPWFSLPERDRWALVAHLKTLSKQFTEDEAPPPVDTNHEPATTPERIRHGHEIYDTAGCTSCHGGGGRGDGPAASVLTYKSGVPAKPRDLRVGRFHRGTRLSEIYLTLVTGLDGTPMASFAKVLQPDDLWDVAMYVHELTPPVIERADGIRCPQIPQEVRCVELPEGLDCPKPSLNPDELIGVGMLMHSLHSKN
jgi:mono/diheme cytochrome c family protein